VSEIETVGQSFEQAFEQHETFRNELASVAPDGRRRWIYARQPTGRYYRVRTIVSLFLLAFLFGAPFIKVHGLPIVLLNVIERRFVLFGVIFWPQDFHLVVLIALTGLVTLLLSTVTIGRVWCGWLCPQTVFMEMLFRKIEFLIEGSAAQQMRRDRGPWNADRFWRKSVKQAIFFGLAFVIANVFLAYIIGADALAAIVTAPPREHLVGLIAITLFSAVFYAVFARFREQACVLACPYGRIMSSLIDRQTITVTYDRQRGEPRGRLIRAGSDTAAGAGGARGDCVDCYQCVTVCPTGIDIRNGVQLECVNCTACMDACDDVMRRVHRAPGLIRLTSHEAVSGGSPRWLTPRVAAYAVVWLLLVIGVGTLIAARPDLDILILRQAGSLFGAEADGQIVNLYTVQVFNRASAARELAIVVRSPLGAKVTLLGPIAHVGSHALQEGRVLVSVPETSLSGPVTPLRFEVRADDGPARSIESSLVGPGGHEHKESR
jgi:cytochrome c oxidase accessory protein FixG